jgi:hypothetical protein
MRHASEEAIKERGQPVARGGSGVVCRGGGQRRLIAAAPELVEARAGMLK